MRIFDSGGELAAFWEGGFVPEYESGVRDIVRDIILDVRKHGDEALRKYTQEFDGVLLGELRVSDEEIREAVAALPEDMSRIFTKAAGNIRVYHERQVPESWSERNNEGVLLGQRYSPVESAGVYVPGGRAVYPSTILMNVIPAQVAGVPRIAVVSPPGENGAVSHLVLACAGILGIDEVYAVGGAQAVGALAYGTESIRPVAKITGPGNKYVNEAKMQVFGKVGIDMPAGPTELIVFADDSAPAEYIVRDLFAQAEHDVDARTLLLTTSATLPVEVYKSIEKLLPEAERADIIRQSLGANGGILQVDSAAEAVELINRLAPEHCELLCEDAEEIAGSISNAGAVFVGKNTPNAVGDYWAGPNHTLPTSGAAKFASPLNVLDFMKFTSLTGYGADSLRKVRDDIARFARSEGLEAHARSVEVRK